VDRWAVQLFGLNNICVYIWDCISVLVSSLCFLFLILLVDTVVLLAVSSNSVSKRNNSKKFPKSSRFCFLGI
jgi:hypothetical protein